jgi:mono/diheme cytochrome c family protein
MRKHFAISSGASFLVLLLSGFAGSCAKPETQAAKELPKGVERGRYLAHHVSLCVFCHSEIDWRREGFPPKAGTIAAGRAPFSEMTSWLTAPNLTPDPETGAGRWTPEQFDRALRQGIGNDGRTLHPVMPYHDFSGMADEDAGALVAYLRSIPPVKHPLPATKIPEEMKGAFAPLPPPGRVLPPDRSAPEKHGEYVARIATCAHCHTPMDKQGKPLPGMEFAGGPHLKGPWGEVDALNITPDRTGLGGMKEEAFLRAMRTGESRGTHLNAIMPWGYYREMTDEDLKALYAFLRTLKPVKHVVDNDEPSTPCKRCGGTHGGGSGNE